MPEGPSTIGGGRLPSAALWGAIAALTATLFFYSQTAAFAWDEGYHLLAAQLVKSGRRLYLDFLFPQTPLNVYWNAAWLKLLGDHWRVAHGLAALLSAGSIVLVADYLHACFPAPAWRTAAALTGSLVMGLNAMVVEFGTVGQAYGMCLFLSAAAFRLAVAGVDRRSALWAAAAGLAAGGAAGASLLTAPVAPVLLLWMAVYNRAGSLWRKAAGFLAGTVVALLPVLWPLVRAPRRTWFSVIEYQLFYRHVEWDGAMGHDLRVMTSWLESSQALLLGLLSAAGLLYVARASGWEARRKAEFYLCAWLAAALMVHLSNAHPTFAQYYLLTVPFLAVLTAAGLYAAGRRLAGPERPHWPVVVLGLLLVMGLAKAISGRTDQHYWRILEQLGRKVEEVTPRGGVLMADEHVYFLTRRLPPSGMELEDSHKLQLPAAIARAVHAISRAALSRQIEAGRFDAVSTCDGEDYAEELGLPKVYAQKAEFDECVLYWQRKRDPAKSGGAAR